ncbi:calcitonin gene-related peptide type 1 receptor-like isoform X2 [Dreissena polymorpha]|nr:calcitonin gene-related peptide type 1 receptor-like isoform X2 [Dreissena polymorpha]XP_052251959.1 calcitonin gene-related peptide type 1 receptor-like isoform X2 [Dreissena polymorpha]XP_052251960.1 calcitonin gene-related peptide type 1 receptor-like isoform X2 [Dreissena polymorpha]XP_052251961.1 calcitonin gene-related peptide type 1 receptor-like isoform X2 [Dreissena polymorpha]XP_052251962.1 calcitonin gene-related peptide type 1 receptor-like isoform X2 [Dreissena polymorpha]XP_05
MHDGTKMVNLHAIICNGLFWASMCVHAYTSVDTSNNTSDTCSWRWGIFTPDDFYLNSCSWCYFYLFPGKNLYPFRDKYLLLRVNHSGWSPGNTFLADANNATSRGLVCSTLTEDQCNVWTMCCNDGRKCCARQLEKQRDATYTNVTTSCGVTWDGYLCWDGGTPGTNSYLSCPSYLKYSVPTRQAVKSCLSNGTWYKKTGQEWSDYTPCLSYEESKVTLYISLGCRVGSLICLIPSLAIFISYKSLRRQHRIRLHINFFTSFVCSNTINVLWDVLVTHDRLTNPVVTDTLIYKDLVLCKVMAFLKMYFQCTNYTWMFCEGLYLYRLIANAFSPPKKLILVYLSGWGVPASYCLAYAIVRVVQANGSCWLTSLGHQEWILYAPNLACLVLNIFFLCSILRILLTQLQTHPNEPSNFRRALKATFVLIPLFGIQLAFTVYRIPPEVSWSVHYERVTEVMTHSQGLFVALVFCFFNGEVATQLKRTCHRVLEDKITSGSHKMNTTISLNFNHSVTQRSSVQSRRNSLEPCLPQATAKSKCKSDTTAHSQLL